MIMEIHSDSRWCIWSSRNKGGSFCLNTTVFAIRGKTKADPFTDTFTYKPQEWPISMSEHQISTKSYGMRWLEVVLTDRDRERFLWCFLDFLECFLVFEWWCWHSCWKEIRQSMNYQMVVVGLCYWNRFSCLHFQFSIFLTFFAASLFPVCQ